MRCGRCHSETVKPNTAVTQPQVAQAPLGWPLTCSAAACATSRSFPTSHSAINTISPDNNKRVMQTNTEVPRAINTTTPCAIMSTPEESLKTRVFTPTFRQGPPSRSPRVPDKWADGGRVLSDSAEEAPGGATRHAARISYFYFHSWPGECEIQGANVSRDLYRSLC